MHSHPATWHNKFFVKLYKKIDLLRVPFMGVTSAEPSVDWLTLIDSYLYRFYIWYFCQAHIIASWLKQVSAKFKINTEDKKITDMKYYIEELMEHLRTVLKTRQRIKERIYATKQLASNYAKWVYFAKHNQNIYFWTH